MNDPVIPSPPARSVAVRARAAESRRARIIAAAGAHPDRTALLLIATTVVVANLLFLLDLFDPNPLALQSGLWDSLRNGLLGGQHTIDPTIGYSSQALGHRAALDILHLQLPWWNPYEGTGTPLAGEMQSAALFPPTLLLALGNGQLYEHMLLELVAGISTYALLRKLELRRVACTAAGIAFALNGTFAWLGNAAVNPVGFLPLVLLGVEHAYAASARRSRGGWWLIAVGGAFTVYAGFPEVTYVDGLLVMVWLAWRCGCLPRGRRVALLVKGASGAAAGALLSAPLLVAFLGFLPHAFVGSHAGGEHVTLPVQAVPQSFMPYVYGPIYQFLDPAGVASKIWGDVGGYVTTSLLVFAILGLCSRQRAGLRALLAAWLVLSIGGIYGLAPLDRLVGLIPGMSSVEFRRYAWPAVELVVIVLAALGLDRLGEVRFSRRRAAGLAAGGAAVVGVAAAAAIGLVDRVIGTGGQYHYFELAVGVALATVLVAAAAGRLRRAQSRVLLSGALIALEALGMFTFAELSAPRNVKPDYGVVDYLAAHLGLGRVYSLGVLKPNYGSYFKLAALNLNDLPIPADLATYIHRQIDPITSPYLLVGTHQSSGNSPSALQELLAHVSGYREAGIAYVATEPQTRLPRTFRLVHRDQAGWIYSFPRPARFFGTTPSTCTVQARGLDAARVSCAAPAALVRRETYLPGWSAHVDGRSVPIRRAGGLLQSVSVPAGTHTISFSYAPPRIGWAFAGIALGWIWVLLGLERIQQRLPLDRLPTLGRGRWAGPALPRLPARLQGPSPPQQPVPPDQPPPVPAATGAFVAISRPEGRVESVHDGLLNGWVWCPDAPEWRVGVRVLVGGEEVTRVIANLSRPSLREAGIGDGVHGFRATLPTARNPGRDLQLRVETAAGVPLPPAAGFSADAITLETGQPTARREVVGFVEQIADGWLSGWLWRPSFPEERLAVWAIVGGHPVGLAIAELPRPSLLAAGIGDGRYGFRIALPADLGSRIVHVTTADGVALPPAQALAGHDHQVQEP